MNKNKVSRYNVEVEYNDGIILYNTLSDAVFPVSVEEYAVIETLVENLSVFEEKYPDLYNAFKKSGFIIDSDFNELAYIRLKNKETVYTNKDFHITINPTLDCNLRCWYCSVVYAGAQHYNERMSDETVEALKKHVLFVVEEQKARSINLDWFGGEPLMYYDEVMKPVFDYALAVCRDKNIPLMQQITTNATLLTKKRLMEMRESGFIFFQITLDGNERHHNCIRSNQDKSGTYQTIIKNLYTIVEMIPNARICLRINYDKQTLKHISDCLKDLADINKTNITVDFQRVWQVEYTETLCELLMQAQHSFKEAGFNTRFWAYKPKCFKRCYSDVFYHYVINYDGKIYKCTARDYSDRLVLGTIHPSGRIGWNEALRSAYYEKATFENEECLGCKMLPLCMGPCIQRYYEEQVKEKPFQCVLNNVELSLNHYVIEQAKNRNLIQISTNEN